MAGVQQPVEKRQATQLCVCHWLNTLSAGRRQKNDEIDGVMKAAIR
jgi:hypothetical protein